MNAGNQVDVLAVLDELHIAVDSYERDGQRRYHKDGAYHMELSRQHYAALELREKLLEARAAVAELIERAEYLCRTGEGMIAFRAALARCGGSL